MILSVFLLLHAQLQVSKGKRLGSCASRQQGLLAEIRNLVYFT